MEAQQLGNNVLITLEDETGFVHLTVLQPSPGINSFAPLINNLASTWT